MLGELFLRYLEVSIQALFIGSAVCVAYMVFKWIRAPRWPMMLLWGVLALRLLVPLEVFSPVSMFQVPFRTTSLADSLRDSHVGEYEVAVGLYKNEQFEKAVQSGVEPVTTDLGWQAVFYTEDEDGAIREAPKFKDVYLPYVAAVWAAGVLLCWGYMAVSLILTRRKFRFAVKDKNAPPKLSVWLSDAVAVPAVIGLWKPRIILPFSLSEQDRAYVLPHEEEHLRCGDHWWKFLGFLVMSLHWYNALLWSLYSVFVYQLEEACDARVLQRLGADARADYSETIVSFSQKKNISGLFRMSFSENYTRDRVKHVLKWKKARPWLCIPVLLLCAALSLTFADARSGKALLWGHTYAAVAVDLSDQTEGDPKAWFDITEDGTLMQEDRLKGNWEPIGRLAEDGQKDSAFAEYFDPSEDISFLCGRDVQRYVVGSADGTTLWKIRILPDRRVYLIKVGFFTEAKAESVWRLDAGLYDPPESLPIPTGTYSTVRTLYPENGNRVQLRIKAEDERFSVQGDLSFLEGAPSEVGSVQYVLWECGDDASENDAVLRFLPAEAPVREWRILKAEEDTGWRLYACGDLRYLAYCSQETGGMLWLALLQ